MDIATLAANQGFTTEEFLEILDVFVDSARGDVSRMTDALDKQDAPTAMEAAHSLKGAAGNVGFSDLFEAAKKAEFLARAEDLPRTREALSDVQRILETIISDLGRTGQRPD
ncbi:MAG: Hpt domain-containing protein [Thermodesulfobacteriota bacterium]